MLKNLMVLPDGTEISTGAGTQNSIKNVETTSRVNDSAELSIGSVCASAIETTIFSVGGNLSLTAGDKITLYKVSDDGTKTKKGVYVLEKPTRPSANTLKLTGYDNVTKLDKDLTAWVNSLTGWPYSLLTFAGMVCNACGLKMVSTSVPNSDFPVYKPAKSNVTGRQLMKWLGEICCRFVRADADGNIEFGWYKSSGVTVAPTGQRYYFQGALSYETYQVAPIEAVQMRLADSESGALWPEVADGANSYVITGNSILMARVTEDLLPYLQVIVDELAGVTYTPCKFAMPACLDVEAGSIVDVTDKNGNTITTYVMSKTTSGQRDTCECTGSYRRDSTTATNNKDENQPDAIGIKTVEVYYYLSTSSTVLSGGSWSTAAPTWVNGMYMWSKTVTTYSDGSSNTSAPVCITGSAGEDGVGVSSITTQFYLSTSKTTQTGGSWVTSMPTWSTGYYLWTRSKIVYTDGTTAYTSPVCDSSWEAVNALDTKLDMAEVLKRLSGGYVNEGLYIENGHLLINGSFIKIGEILADLITAGILKSKDGLVYFDLDSGIMHSMSKDGSTEASLSAGMMNATSGNQAAYLVGGMLELAYEMIARLQLQTIDGEAVLALMPSPADDPDYDWDVDDLVEHVIRWSTHAGIPMITDPDYTFAVNLASEVTGTLPVAKGGTGATTAAQACSNIGARPATYVYGSKNGGNCNSYLTETHLFAFNMSNKPSAYNYGWFDVWQASGSGFSPNGAKAIILQRWIDWQSYGRAWRYSTDGGTTWTAWAYDNPPLAAGVEYLTTEYYNSKPVYKKRIVFGALPSTGVSTVAHGISDATAYSDVKCIINRSNGEAFTAGFAETGVKAQLTSSGTIQITTTWGAASYTADVILSYIK